MPGPDRSGLHHLSDFLNKGPIVRGEGIDCTGLCVIRQFALNELPPVRCEIVTNQPCMVAQGGNQRIIEGRGIPDINNSRCTTSP